MIHEKSVLEKKVQTLFPRVVGIDESGCANYVGPAIVAGVVLPKGDLPCSVDDCKKLTAHKLQQLYHILTKTVTYSYEIITVPECNKALLKSEYHHIKKMCAQLHPDFVLIDYHSIPDKFHYPQWGVEGGDEKLWCVAAASVISKYVHDQILIRLDKQYPEFNLKSNKGAVGQQLFDLTLQHGITSSHRQKWIYSTAEKKKIPIENIFNYTGGGKHV